MSLVVALSLAAPALAQDCPNLVGWLGVQYAAEVAASSGYAYVVEEGLKVIDVSDPYHPVEVGFNPASGVAVAVSGSYVYVIRVQGEIVLSVIDVSDPASPVEVGSVGLLGGGWARDVAVSGDYAYVVSYRYYGHFSVIDVSTPSAPVEVGFHPAGGVGVAVSGGYAYVAAGGGLIVIDVSTPSAPVDVGFVDVGGADSVAVSGSYAYSAGYDGLHVIDVSEPSAPFEVGFLGTPTAALDVAVSRGYAYVAVNDEYSFPGGGPTRHRREHTVGTGRGGFLRDDWGGCIPGHCEGVAVSDGYVFLVNSGGLFIFRECSPLFTDGFESGDTSRWSATVP